MRHASVPGSALLACLCFAFGLPGAGATEGRPPDRFAALAPGDVTVGGEIGRRIRATIDNNLLAVDIERDFLAPFAAAGRKGAYIGLGKLIDATVRLAAHTGDPRLLQLKDRLVASVAANQEPDGYVGTHPPEKRIWTLWDVHEMSYLIYGLVQDHRLFGQTRSLSIARRLAGFVVARLEAAPDRIPGGGSITRFMACTGLENALIALDAESGDVPPRFAGFLEQFVRLPEWRGRIVLGRHGTIEGHAYAHLCRCIAQLRLDRRAPDPRLNATSADTLDFLLRRDGLTVTGEVGDHECWHDTQEGTIHLGESCATAYLVRFLDELLRRDADPLLGDVMERAIHNAGFAAQSPDGRRIRYYTPFDGPRQYHPGDTYCCPNNLRRLVAELPGFIYYGLRPGVAINLYTPSNARVRAAAGAPVRVIQETDYPNSGKVAIRIEPERPSRFPVRLRIPRWAKGATLKLNGRAESPPPRPGSFHMLEREWSPGDRIDLELPMTVRLVRGRQAQAGRVALLRGPLVFCLSRKSHPDLRDIDLRLLVLDPTSIRGPFPDATVHPGGCAIRAWFWKPGAWYPQAKPTLDLELREFADPDGEATYFKVPDPNDRSIVGDELIAPAQRPGHAILLRTIAPREPS